MFCLVKACSSYAVEGIKFIKFFGSGVPLPPNSYLAYMMSMFCLVKACTFCAVEGIKVINFFGSGVPQPPHCYLAWSLRASRNSK